MPKQERLRFTLIISAVFFVAAFGLYAMVGSPAILPLMKERAARIEELKKTIVADSEYVKTHPRDLRSWVELGQSFIETGQFKAAAIAFKQAVVISEGNPQLILAYAKSMIMNEGGQVSDLSQKSLQMVLIQEPQNPDARYFMAVRELQDGHQEDAMRDMKNLYKSLPADSALKETIDRQIGRK